MSGGGMEPRHLGSGHRFDSLPEVVLPAEVGVRQRMRDARQPVRVRG
jgi:hypothetical protein